MKISITKAFAVLTFAAFFGFVPSAKTADNGWFFKPYLGVDAERLLVDYNYSADKNLFDDKFENYNIHLGARVHKHLGIELGYGSSSTEKKSIDELPDDVRDKFIDTSGLQFKSWALDLFGYLPLDEEERFELIATAGVVRTKADIDNVVTIDTPFYKGSISKKDNIRENGWRVGGGFQYHLSDRWSARFLARYLDYGGKLNLDLWSLGVGVNFSF